MGLPRPVRTTDKSDDVYQDYLNIVVGYSFDATKIQWRLDSAATFAEYETWESHMVRGFARCRTLDSKFGGHMEYVIAYRRVDTKVASCGAMTGLRRASQVKHQVGRISSNFCVLDLCRSLWSRAWWLFQRYKPRLMEMTRH
jgi:hypothetical protein